MFKNHELFNFIFNYYEYQLQINLLDFSGLNDFSAFKIIY